MSQAFYSHARLYDLMFPGGGPAVDFFRAAANRQGGSVLELGCGTGQKLIPIASDEHPCVGLDSSSDMLVEAQRKAKLRGVAVEWMQGDMRAFDLGGTFDFVFITANSLLHLHEAEDLVSCFRSLRRHLAPGARLVFDVFNPSVRLLAEADGVRRNRESLSFTDPDRGDVSVDVAEIYDAAAQVTRGTWYLSTDSEPDFVVAPLEIRSIFPQELPLLVSLGGLRLVDRFGAWSGQPFAADSPFLATQPGGSHRWASRWHAGHHRFRLRHLRHRHHLLLAGRRLSRPWIRARDAGGSTSPVLRRVRRRRSRQ